MGSATAGNEKTRRGRPLPPIRRLWENSASAGRIGDGMDEGRTFPLAVTPNPAWGVEAKSARVLRSSGGGHGIFATIVTGDRVAQSRILARSARECHPDARLAVLV